MRSHFPEELKEFLFVAIGNVLLLCGDLRARADINWKLTKLKRTGSNDNLDNWREWSGLESLLVLQVEASHRFVDTGGLSRCFFLPYCTLRLGRIGISEAV